MVQVKTNILRLLLLVFVGLTLQQNVAAQDNAVGKVEFYKSKATEWLLSGKFFVRDAKDNYTKNLNKLKRKIQIIQNDATTETVTDSLGFFRFNVSKNDSITILVNSHSPILSGKFKFDSIKPNDTLVLRISDYKLAISHDSLLEPEFYHKYNEQQAKIDYQNGKRIILLLAFDWPTQETTENRKRFKALYNVTYNYTSLLSHSKLRIMIRYNDVIRELLGAKEEIW